MWEDLQKQLSDLGLKTASQVGEIASQKIVKAVGGSAGSTGQDSVVKQDPSVAQANPWDIAGAYGDFANAKVAGISVPLIIAAGVLIYFIAKKA